MISLIDYCKNGDIENVKKYINKDNINKKNNYGNTFISTACLFDRIEIVKTLINIENFNTINDKNYFGDSPFLYACQFGYVEIVKTIMNIDSFNSLNEPDSYGNTPFILACKCENFDIVNLLLMMKDFDGLNKKNNFGSTPFTFACQYGYIDIAKLLIQTKCFNSLNEPNNKDRTPLSLACEFGRIEIVKMLLQINLIIVPEQLIFTNIINQKNKTDIEILINAYREDSKLVVMKLILGSNIDIYRHLVFLSDDYYVINKKNIMSQDEQNIIQFLKITTKLPSDLLALIIMRLSGSSKQFITSNFFNENIKCYEDKYLTKIIKINKINIISRILKYLF